jgi:hypothetical protein
MGFANTAAFFAHRAQKAREPDEKQRLLEIARFYYQLAGITPDFPEAYKPSGLNGHAARWLARAEECRAIADHLKDPKCREQLAQLADTYARMAKAAE